MALSRKWSFPLAVTTGVGLVVVIWWLASARSADGPMELLTTTPADDHVVATPVDYPAVPSGLVVGASVIPSVGQPQRLEIPRIRVNATVEFVGRTLGGVMVAPHTLTDVAWLTVGPRPGEPGTAVMAGHYGWERGVAAVFNSLHTLQPGDAVLVRDENGSSIAFTVRRLQTYTLQEDVSSVFTSTDGLIHLNLITCEGVWNAQKQAYPKRLVVFTDRVAS